VSPTAILKDTHSVEGGFCELRLLVILRTSPLRSSKKFIHDTARSPTTGKGPGLAINLSELRSGYPDGVLALGVCACEST
jgi:hypothetical protein